MLNHDKTSLRIFDQFEIDYTLPKWEGRKQEGASFIIYNNVNRRNTGTFVSGNLAFMPSVAVGGVASGSDASNEKEKSKSFFSRIFSGGKSRAKKEEEMRKFAEKAYEPPKIEELPEPTPEISVEEFFSSIKNSVEEIPLVKERIENYEKALDKFKKLGQIALYENMKMEVEVHRAESQLYGINMRKFVSEENLVKFVKKSDKKLRLDWVKNFVRFIPHEVTEKKLKADENNIFDNYVVLHYDPDGTGAELTVEEKEKKADPILFGVIVGRRKLYYVGDWIDEYCDLTFDKMVSVIGEGSIGTILPEITE